MKECDSRQGARVKQLLNLAPDRRDEKWKKEFLTAVVDAPFVCGRPQLFIGPDGFSYFALYTPPPKQPFNAYCISNLIEPLTERGIGISINPQQTGVDWVFTAGDLLTYRLYNSFTVWQESHRVPAQDLITPLEEDQVLIGVPSASYLPGYTRRILRRFIEDRLGIRNPGVCLMRRPAQDPMEYLVFSIHPDQFPNAGGFQFALNAVTWFLPRHYRVCGMSKEVNWTRYLQPL